MNSEMLDKVLKDLSQSQRKAAEWDEGSLLVLAGPGSGKTKVLTYRIAKILDSTRDQNFRILGLTFTNKASDEMRTRVSNLVSGQESRLFLGTFHSFCSDILRQHGTHLNINTNFRIYSQENDLQAVLNDAVEEGKKKSILISDIDKKTLPVIQGLKSRLILPEKCSEVFSEDKRNIRDRISIIYPEYELQLTQRNALDFQSLILKAYQLFTKFPAFAKRYRKVYPYICIDEFQDINLAQYSLIRALTAKEHKNLFVVADDDQVIYQWNGASHQRIENFIKDYKPHIIQLPVNYRCPPEIVQLANNLIHHNFLRTPNKEPLEAGQKTIGKNVVRLLPCFSSIEDEAFGIAKDIKDRHIDNLNSVTILARNRKLLNDVMKVLLKEGLSAVISQRKDEFESTPFIWLHSTLRLANDRQDSNSLEAICGTFFQLTQVNIDSEEVITHAKASNHDYLRHWVEIAYQKSSNNLAIEGIDNMSKYLGEGREFQDFSKSAIEWFQKLIKNQEYNNENSSLEVFTGYEEEKSTWENITREIIEHSRNKITLEAFLQEMQMRSKETQILPNTITLMTIHGAKGKEFEHVYLVGLVEDELPSFQSKQKGNTSSELEEERRNCYVAITRTVKSLTLSYAEKYRGSKRKPSRFLYEMGLLQ